MEEDGNGQGVTMAIASPEASDIGIFTIKKCGVFFALRSIEILYVTTQNDDCNAVIQGLVCLSHFGYIGHHPIVAIKKTIYHSWLGDVTHGDI